MTSDFHLPSDLSSAWAADASLSSFSSNPLATEFGDSDSISSPIQTHNITPKITPSEFSEENKLAVISEENSCTPKKLTAEKFARKFTDQEKFELLSAYLDDEVSELEHSLVEHWLSSDLALQQHYQAQIKLRKAIRLLYPK